MFKFYLENYSTTVFKIPFAWTLEKSQSNKRSSRNVNKVLFFSFFLLPPFLGFNVYVSGANAIRVDELRKKEKHEMAQHRSKSKNTRKKWEVESEERPVGDHKYS